LECRMWGTKSQEAEAKCEFTVQILTVNGGMSGSLMAWVQLSG